MKRLLNVARGLLGLLALGALVLALALSLGGLQRSTKPGVQVFQSPMGTPTRPPYPPPELPTVVPTPPGPPPTVPPYPPPGGTPPVEPPTQPSPTPLPDRGVRLGPPTEVVLSGADVPIERLYNPDLDGNTLVASARVPAGVAVVAVDLETGRVQRLSRVAERGAELPRVSGQYVVWTEPDPALGRDIRRLQAYDRAQGRESTVGRGVPFQLDLANSIVVWQENRGRGWGIYGYNLETRQEFTVADGASSYVFAYPRVAYPWVIYIGMEFNGARRPSIADLWARNLETDETLRLSNVLNPNDATAGSYHAIDNQRVAWVTAHVKTYTGQEVNPQTGASVTTTGTTWAYEFHVYDLSTRTDQTLDIPVQWPPRVLISGNVVVFGNIGFDLDRNVPFNAIPDLPAVYVSRSPLMLSGDRVVLLMNGWDDTQQLYTARITRDATQQ